jgi:Amt family ammonium transporter
MPSTAFLIVCASLVLLMTTPAGPLLRRHVPGQIGPQHDDDVVRRLGVVGIIYVLYGYSMSFGPAISVASSPIPSTNSAWQGHRRAVNPFGYEGYGNIPELAFVGFQLTFAVITVALISGAIADRVKFSTWLVFSGLWVTLAYFPIAHMVWGGGLLSGSRERTLGEDLRVDGRVANVAPIDFAGGTVVHINAGMAGLVLALVVGKRLGFGKVAMRPTMSRS